MRNNDHVCDPDDKHCREGADPQRHDHSIPWDHPSQHSSHVGGCSCPHRGSTALTLVLCQHCEHPADGDDEMCAECRSEHEPCCDDYYCPCGNQTTSPSSDVN